MIPIGPNTIPNSDLTVNRRHRWWFAMREHAFDSRLNASDRSVQIRVR